MRKNTPISLIDLKQKIEAFKNDINNFSKENESQFENQLKDIKDDVQFVLLESTDRQDERIQRRTKKNDEIREYNKKGPHDALLQYIQSHTEEFLATMHKKWFHVDDTWDMNIGKVKKNRNKINIASVSFTPKPLIGWDHYGYVREILEGQGQATIAELTKLFEIAQTKARNIFEYYTIPSELFKKLGISVQKVNYSFFAQEPKKDKIPRKGGSHDGGRDKVDPTPPTFKKIWLLMKYLLENNIPFRANNIIEDNNQRYQFYFYDKDITILISDEVSGNCFRDSTYAIKWIVPGLRNVNKEELKNYQGKKIVYNENRNRRMESVFTDDPQNRPIIGEEKDDIPIMPKTLITDRATFISIIREHFTPETFNGASYRKFAQEYNATQENELLLNDTIYWAVSLLGLWGKKTVDDIKKAIFEFKKPKLEIPKDSYLFNEYTKQHLLDIQGCEWFDSEKMLGSVNYASRINELLRKACKEEYVDAVKNKSPKEKREKLQEYTGVKDIPLNALKMTTMLGWCVRCIDTDYQKILRKRFMMHINREINMQEYKDLQKEILEYETNWEDKELRPHTNKSDRKVKQTEENTDIQKTEKPKEQQKVVVSKNVKKVQDDTQNTLLNVLKDPITMETFPLHVVKSVKVVGENSLYRIVKAYNCPVELRLSKLSVGNNAVFKHGDKIEVFGLRKNEKKWYIMVSPEREKWVHKLIKFRDSHPDKLLDECIRGETYDALVNNVGWKFVYVSLTKNYSGRMIIQSGEEYKIGDVVKVIFDGIGTNHHGNIFIKLH